MRSHARFLRAEFTKKHENDYRNFALRYAADVRRPDHVDPSFEPSKLLLIRRVKPFAGNPWWEKKVLKNLGFEEKVAKVVCIKRRIMFDKLFIRLIILQKHGDVLVIVKNTPDMCAMLWKVKHLIKIVPIKLPDKLPTTDDLNGTYLHENGTFYVVPKVESVCEEAVEQFINNPKKLNRDIIQDKLRLKWLEGNLM
ncbi:RM30 protein, partial [Acromyrmex insinuator]